MLNSHRNIKYMLKFCSKSTLARDAMCRLSGASLDVNKHTCVEAPEAATPLGRNYRRVLRPHQGIKRQDGPL